MNARIAALSLALATAAGAQEVNLAQGAENRVVVRTGAEYGLVAGVGYARSMALFDRTVLLGGELAMPWAAPDAGDWRLRATALVPVFAGDRWKLAATLAPTLRETSDDAARLTGLGADFGALFGWYAPGWFAAAEAGFDWEIATRVVHSDLYRQTVYGGARDGWYANAGGNLRLGLQGGLSFSRYDLVLRVGKLRDVKGEGPMFPLYGTLALDVRF